MKAVLCACIHNAGRSQMAAALFNQLADPELAREAIYGRVTDLVQREGWARRTT